MLVLEGVSFSIASCVILHYGQSLCGFKLESFILEKKLDFPKVFPISAFQVAASSAM